MTWDEVGDLDAPAPVCSIPAARMKMKRDHDVPLSPRAAAILREQRAKRTLSGFGGHPFVFEGERPRRPLSNTSLSMTLRRTKAEVTAHGFRSSFRSWCADHAVAFEVAEACLAHSSSSVVEAYQRSSMLERRRPVMEAWAAYLGGETSANVVSFRAAG